MSVNLFPLLRALPPGGGIGRDITSNTNASYRVMAALLLEPR